MANWGTPEELHWKGGVHAEGLCSTAAKYFDTSSTQFFPMVCLFRFVCYPGYWTWQIILFAVCGDRENNVQRQQFFFSPTHNTMPHLMCMPCPLVWLAGPVPEYLVLQHINKSCNYYFPSLQTILITFAHIYQIHVVGGRPRTCLIKICTTRHLLPSSIGMQNKAPPTERATEWIRGALAPSTRISWKPLPGVPIYEIAKMVLFPQKHICLLGLLHVWSVRKSTQNSAYCWQIK